MYMYLRSKNSKHGEIGMPYYVGKGKGRRAFNKQHCIPVPSNKSSIVIVASGLSENAAFDEEKRLIVFYGRIDNGTGCLRNRTNGGDGGGGHHFGSNRTTFRSGHQHSEEALRKMSQAKLGRSLSEETRAKMRLSSRHIGKGLPVGFKHSEETKQKMRQRALERPSMSQEQRLKIGAAFKGKPWTSARREAYNVRKAGKAAA